MLFIDFKDVVALVILALSFVICVFVVMIDHLAFKVKQWKKRNKEKRM